jgi:hypothetical protein
MKTKKIELSGFIDYTFWQSEETYSINLFKHNAYDGLTKCTITLEVPFEEKVYSITESELDAALERMDISMSNQYYIKSILLKERG